MRFFHGEDLLLLATFKYIVLVHSPLPLFYSGTGKDSEEEKGEGFHPSRQSWWPGFDGCGVRRHILWWRWWLHIALNLNISHSIIASICLSAVSFHRASFGLGIKFHIVSIAFWMPFVWICFCLLCACCGQRQSEQDRFIVIVTGFYFVPDSISW